MTLQETYSTESVEHSWKSEWEGNILFSHGSSHARGVMILFKLGFNVKVSKTIKDNIGRYILVDVVIQDAKFTLINIYAANSEDNQVTFFNYLEKEIKLYTAGQEHILLGGDFNFIVNPRNSSTDHSAIILKLSSAVGRGKGR